MAQTLINLNIIPAPSFLVRAILSNEEVKSHDWSRDANTCTRSFLARLFPPSSVGADAFGFRALYIPFSFYIRRKYKVSQP